MMEKIFEVKEETLLSSTTLSCRTCLFQNSSLNTSVDEMGLVSSSCPPFSLLHHQYTSIFVRALFLWVHPIGVSTLSSNLLLSTNSLWSLTRTSSSSSPGPQSILAEFNIYIDRTATQTCEVQGAFSIKFSISDSYFDKLQQMMVIHLEEKVPFSNLHSDHIGQQQGCLEMIHSLPCLLCSLTSSTPINLTTFPLQPYDPRVTPRFYHLQG